jgi:hypothetical protein
MVIFSRTEGVDDAAFVLRRYVARLHREAGIEIKVVSTDNPPTGVGEDGVPSPAGRTCVRALQLNDQDARSANDVPLSRRRVVDIAQVADRLSERS